jgi:hypothetical protein
MSTPTILIKCVAPSFVIPAKAGIQSTPWSDYKNGKKCGWADWTPAFAGVTAFGRGRV